MGENPEIFNPEVQRYLVSDEDIHDRVIKLLRDRPPTTSEAIVCYQLESDDDELSDVARTVERTVFEKRFGNDAEKMSAIYEPYENASIFFLSVDQVSQQPVGALRAIHNSSSGMMTFNTLPEEATSVTIEDIQSAHNIKSLDDCWDIGTVAVMPDYRKVGKGVSVQLYRAMYKSAMENNIKHLLSIIDKGPYETMTQYLGIPFEPLAKTEPFSYEGSDTSIAVHGYVPDFYPMMKKKSLRLKGILARKALWPLVFGTKDDAIRLK